jgi:hypothetical protein
MRNLLIKMGNGSRGIFRLQRTRAISTLKPIKQIPHSDSLRETSFYAANHVSDEEICASDASNPPSFSAATQVSSH